jgi:hypothetical protein
MIVAKNIVEVDGEIAASYAGTPILTRRLDHAKAATTKSDQGL